MSDHPAQLGYQLTLEARVVHGQFFPIVERKLTNPGIFDGYSIGNEITFVDTIRTEQFTGQIEATDMQITIERNHLRLNSTGMYHVERITLFPRMVEILTGTIGSDIGGRGLSRLVYFIAIKPNTEKKAPEQAVFTAVSLFYKTKFRIHVLPQKTAGWYRLEENLSIYQVTGID